MEETWCLDIKKNTELNIKLLQPQRMCYIACELGASYEGTELEIRYESSYTWDVDSLHYPSYDTGGSDEQKLHKFYIKATRNYTNWKLSVKNATRTVLGRNLQIYLY